MTRRWSSAKDMLEARSEMQSSGCRVWRGSLNSDGYASVSGFYWGRFYQVTKAHQLSYIVYNGEYNRDKVIRHSCHTPACINPEHLSTGSRLDNMRDMVLAGRSSDNRGIKNPANKLTEGEVRQIRDLCKIMMYIHIAPLYSITPTAVGYINRKVTWGHI